MNWKARAKRLIPPRMLNATLLALPFLYSLSLVDYESNLRPEGGLVDLLSQADLAASIPGNILECGSSRCGSTVILAKHLRSRQVRKTIYAHDSFEGFDRTELYKERVAKLTDTPDDAFTSTSFEYVKAKINRLGVGEMIVPVKGYFQQTLPHLQGDFALALIDCDLQDSLVYCAETIWPHLSPGGRLLFDDYTSKIYLGACIGVDAFVKKHQREIVEHGLLNRLYYVVKQ